MNPKKILVVDDEENIRIFLKEELEDEGYEIILASNGMEALDKLKERPFDLVVLDVRMPGMDGFKTLQEIKKEYQDLPVILCSAYGEYKHDLVSWLSDGYVVKSSDSSELKRTIKKILSEKEKGV